MNGLVRSCIHSRAAGEVLEWIVPMACSLLRAESWLISEFVPVAFADKNHPADRFDNLRISWDTMWLWSQDMEGLTPALKEYNCLQGFDMLAIWLLAKNGTLSSRSLPSLPLAHDWDASPDMVGLDVQGEGCLIVVHDMTMICVFGPDELLAEVQMADPKFVPMN